jgi:2-polyprenyl-3-methyl-5-hydroxy-6-metoxy-1,4-benzoquinol methylase
MDCRLCGGGLFPESVLRLPGMPIAAQAFVNSRAEAGRSVDLDIRQCSACGLVQLDAEPVPYFKSVITSARWSEEMLKFRTNQACAFVSKFGLANRKVIEIGCGSGYYLDLLHQAGAQAYGLEYGEAAVVEARANGRSVDRGYPEHGMSVPNAPFDAFVCINFLEHAPEPRKFLTAITGILTDNAVGLVEVPNLDTAVARRRYYDFIRDHLSYFSTATLTHALEGSGFEVLECGTAWHDDDIVALVRRRAKADYNRWVTENPVVSEFDRLVADPSHSGIAIWGASHQALTLIALTKPKRVQFLVDSSPVKQGRFEPTLGLPILKPEAILQKNIDMVVVMAAGYSDEVCAILLNRMRFSGTIAVLRETHFELKGPRQ